MVAARGLGVIEESRDHVALGGHRRDNLNRAIRVPEVGGSDEIRVLNRHARLGRWCGRGVPKIELRAEARCSRYFELPSTKVSRLNVMLEFSGPLIRTFPPSGEGNVLEESG